MATAKFRQLIDMAIGSPEPGHVNFYALHCLLSCIAEKLNIIDEAVDYSKYEAMIQSTVSAKASNHDLRKLFCHGTRFSGGSDPDDDIERNLTGNALESGAEPEVPTLIDDRGQTLESVPKDPIELQLAEPEEVVQDIKNVETTTTTVLSPVTSVRSNKSDASHPNLPLQDGRVSKVEPMFSDDFLAGVTIMKDQLEMSMEQLLLLTYLTLCKKPDTPRVHQLLGLAQALHAIRNENANFQVSNRFALPTIPSIDWHSTDLQPTEVISEEYILETQPSCSKPLDENLTALRLNNYDLESCLSYSPEKMLDQLMNLKRDFCSLTIKVNELSANLLKQERQQTRTLVQELQDQMRDVKLNITNLKEKQDRVEIRVTNHTINIENIKKSLEEILAEKVDKAEMEILLADKVDYNQLQRKVSLDQILEVQCRIDKRFCEVFRQINENDKKVEGNVESLRQTLGFAAIEGILDSFKQQIAQQIRSLRDSLQKYVDSTNDDCAAAGGRTKVLQDLACISCDSTCVMRTVEKSKVPKLPNAHTSPILSPLITYELSSIRKSAVLGYYRKDHLSHAPQARMTQRGAAVPRHAGGPHTITSAREHVEKVRLSGK